MSDLQIAISIFFGFLCGHLTGIIAVVWIFQQLQRNEREAKQRAAAEVQETLHNTNDQSVWSLPPLRPNKFGASTLFHPRSSGADFDGDGKPN